MSPYKSDPTISKPLHTINSPMILGAPQRMNSSNQRSLQVGASLIQATSWDSKHDNFIDNGKRNNKSREKGGKGLRHFSMKVCEKVQKKGVTSYNEVADELVGEFSDSQRCRSPTDLAYDQKNIRRRVYDALNVLMAMNIISKEKKEIKWLGLPTNSAQDCIKLEQEKLKRLERIRVKTQQVQELILQHIAYKNLITRNGELEKSHGNPSSNSTIQLPFIIVNTDKETVIDCCISADKMEYLFSFDNMFQIHDDIEILKRMGLAYSLEKGQCSEENYLKAKKMIPKALEHYVKQIYETSNEVPIAGTSKVESNLENEFQKLRSRDDPIVTDSDKAESLEGRLSRYSSSTSLSDVGSAHVENAISDEEDFSGSPLDDED